MVDRVQLLDGRIADYNITKGSTLVLLSRPAAAVLSRLAGLEREDQQQPAIAHYTKRHIQRRFTKFIWLA